MKFHLFVSIATLILPVFSKAQTAQIRIQAPETQHSLTLEYFAPIGGEFQNYHFPTIFSKTESDPSYTASFNLKKPAFVQIKGPIGTHYLYVEPGDTVQANLMTRNSKSTLAFLGKHHEANQVFNDWMRQTDFKQIQIDLDKYIHDPEKFNAYSSGQIVQFQAPFHKLKAENKLSEAALELFNMQIFAKYFARFLIFNLIASGAPSIETMSPLQQTLFPDSLVNDSRWIYLNEGNSYLSSYKSFSKKLNTTEPQNTELLDFGTYRSYAVVSHFHQQHMLANAMFIQIRMGVTEFDYDQALESYKKIFPKSPFIPLLMENSPSAVQQPTRTIITSNSTKPPAVQATAKVIRYASGSLSIEPFVLIPDLTALIKQYGEGKTLLLDFWATWCVPCIQEFPHSRALKSFFEEEDVIPIYISTDKTEAMQKWERMIVQYGLEGIHVFAGLQLDKNLKEEYQIHTIPRYMIVSANGEIAELNAPRPSNREELKRLILKAKN